ncbi:MAG TPA: hypothetical protein ENN03_11900 [bacterium]|nr:hypothetical protein [bacterium]
MINKNICLFFLLFLNGFIVLPVNDTQAGTVNERVRIELIEPRSGVIVRTGELNFIWEIKTHDDKPVRIIRYEVTFWAERQSFSRTFTVVPDSGVERASFLLTESRDIFRRHGQYFWRITAYDAANIPVQSQSRDFMVLVSHESIRYTHWIYPYAVEFQYTQRLRSEQYVQFMESLQSSDQFTDYSTLAFMFHQERIWGTTLEFEERFLLLTQIGLGIEAGPRFRLIKNLFFSLYPRASVKSMWFSTGLKNYSTNLFSWKAGMELAFNPKENICIAWNWIPEYRIRYALQGGELRTFKGRGWQAGIRIRIPETMIPPFTIAGMGIDFRRIPIEFTISEIVDEYTDVIMRMRSISVAFLFW